MELQNFRDDLTKRLNIQDSEDYRSASIDYVATDYKEVEETYKKLSLVTRVSLVFQSIFKNNAYSDLKKFRNNCYNQAAHHYLSDSWNFDYALKADLGDKDIPQQFKNGIITRLKEKILDEPGKGLIYEVKNPANQAVGYFIGTLHVPPHLNRNVIITETMRNAVDNSKTLITELGTDFLGNIFQFSTLDSKLTLHAWSKKKKIVGLDSFSSALKALSKHIITLAKIIFFPESHLSFDEQSEKRKLFNLTNSSNKWMEPYDLILAWKKDDTSKLVDYANNSPSALMSERNIKWLEEDEKKPGLLQRFSQATEEDKICVAVGTAHLLGYEGLIKEFERKGYTVSKIEQNS